MLEKINIAFKFDLGATVVHDLSETTGKIIKRWSSINKIDNESYTLVKTYTVQPIKGQRVKIKESELVNQNDTINF